MTFVDQDRLAAPGNNPVPSDRAKAVAFARLVLRGPNPDPNTALLARQLLRALALSEQG